MGGDHGPSEIIPAALDSLARNEDIKIILVGDAETLSQTLKANNATESERLSIHHASELVEMHESPSIALRSKKDSSMRVAINLVKDEVAQACVSAGNTGALMAISRFVLKMLPGIDRPAICAMMPGIDGHTHILDLGANVNPNSDQLFQYAVMGAELTKAVENIENPTIGLLNVGEEEIKGDDRVKQAAALLNNSHLNYVGFVEGNDIYTGKVDVIVCDGFAGNIALKASEGVAQLLTMHAKNEFNKSLYGRLSALVTLPVLNSVRRKLDPRRYNGASLLGLRGIVVKSHGSADKLSFAHAIQEAIIEVDKNVPDLIIEELEIVFQEIEVN
jgi:glycerol-3-phosphate acyltransferase PlsX